MSLLPSAVRSLVLQIGLLRTGPGGTEGEDGEEIQALTPADLGCAAGMGGVAQWEAATLGRSEMAKERWGSPTKVWFPV